HALELNYLNINELAFLFACADLSYQMDASPAKISHRQEITLYKARHPLLDKTKVVPITVALGEGQQMLVITGPNTGGKTVTLKTIGLFTMMTQAGLHIPAEDTSRIGIFDEIFSDIGDEQSIEQSLSTFSSHMKGIVPIIETMTERSLVLFDELGAGTDPVEGAALAMSILEEVRVAGALCAATTHYAELKSYALETEGVCNASCEFDVSTLRPTYRLIIGTPGKSNAFAISEKLGLPETIVKRAENFVDTGSRNFEGVIEKLETTRHELEAEKSEVSRLKQEFSAYKAKAEKELAEKVGKAEKEAEKIRQKAQETLDGARITSQYVFDQLEQLKREKDAADLAEKIANAKKDVRKRVRDYDDRMNPDMEPEEDEEEYIPPRPFRKGDAVRHRNIGTNGILLDDPDKNGNVNLRMGAVKTRANVADLRLLDEAEQKKEQKKNGGGMKTSVSRSFKTECDVRGMTGEEAWFVVDKYLDEAKVVNIKSVMVIHGKGTGALRSALWKEFKNDSRVASFRAGQ
ncbi:MAG: Smr/MutS family protein, partial [Clostridia bacterium]|nr:Smr/MutS family protein [Clostridia bacterium]